jgi:hypothetical protein
LNYLTKTHFKFSRETSDRRVKISFNSCSLEKKINNQYKQLSDVLTQKQNTKLRKLLIQPPKRPGGPGESNSFAPPKKKI